MPTASKPRQNATKRSVRDADPKVLKPAGAARRISLSYDTIISAVARDVFTIAAAPHGRGRGKPVWIYTDEVDAFMVGRDAAVRALRIEKGRLKPDLGK